MWGILKDMVSTRRSSARLQEKTASAPSSPTPSATQASPVRKTRSSATKATPPSGTRGSGRKSTPTKSTGSATKRPRRTGSKSGSSESDDAVATESDSVSEQQDNGSAAEENESEVKKKLFAEEAPKVEEQATPKAAEPLQETVKITVVEKQVVVEKTVVETTVVEEKVEEVPQVEEEEEEEIVMMADSDEEDDEEPSAEEADAAEDEDDDDDEIDIAEFAKMAATGISLSTSSSLRASNATAASASKSGYNLVPDALDSGASSRTKFLEFEGSKLALGAKIVTHTAAVEEKKVLDQQLGKVAKANRQREEAKNDTSAGRKWFDMSTHEMDADARRDFALLRMRNYLDPKKFYKTSDHTKKMPKHFQFGTVIEGAHEFKSARLSKKERKQTFTEEIMADDAIRKYTKRVFLQVQNSKAGQAKKKQKTKGRF